MLVSEEYPWRKLLREYATYCAVGCINVVVFFVLYDWLYGMGLSERFPAASAWAIARAAPPAPMIRAMRNRCVSRSCCVSGSRNPAASVLVPASTRSNAG